MAAPTPGPPLSRGPSLLLRQQRSSVVKSSTLTVEEVLGASGTQQAEAVIFVSLSSGFYSSLDPRLAGFTNLREIDLSGNQLQDVSALAQLPSLSKINLAGNQLHSWAHGPGDFPALEILDCSYNHGLQPRVIHTLSLLPRLQVLDISGNGLHALPPLDAAAAFPSLRRLTAGHNELTGAALAALAPLPELQHLLLPSNRIGAVPALDQAAAFLKLALLDLSHNQVADMETVNQLQGLASLERLLLLGNPVANAGFGAHGTVSAVLHRAHAGTRRSSMAARAAGATRGSNGRPSLAQVFQFKVVEEASVVSMKAKALAQSAQSAQSRCGMPKPGSGISASASGISASARASSTCVGGGGGTLPVSSAWGEPQPEGEADGAAEAVQAEEAAADAAAAGTTTPFRASTAEFLRMPAPTSPPLPTMSFLDWELAGEDEDEEGEGEDAVCWQYTASASDIGGFWSVQSAAGSGETAGGLAEDGPFEGVDDPTVRVALGLGLDPLRLPMFGGPGTHSGNPAAAIQALRFALSHPAASPSMEGILAVRNNGSHLRLTKSVLAKQRQKAGAAGGKEGGVEGRVATIDALLLAMRRRLAAVQAALAADAEQARLQESASAVQEGTAPSLSPDSPAEAAAAGEETQGAASAAGDVAGSSAAQAAGSASAALASKQERERRASEWRMRQAAHMVLGAQA